MSALVLWLVLAAGVAAECPGSFVGLEFRDTPEGLRFRAGGMLEDTDSQQFAIRHVSCERAAMLWLERVRRQDDGKVRYQVLDVLHLPAPAEDMRVIFGNLGCRRDGEYDSEIVALVHAGTDDVRFYTDVRQAWRASRQDGRFRPTEIEGIDCETMGWGVE